MKSLEFEDDGRTYTCRAESSPATPGLVWWWISVTGETQRYAAFAVQPNDTERNLRPRIRAYYEQLLANRTRPREIATGWGRGRPPKKAESSGPEDSTDTNAGE